jgi:hypothetical protein
VARFTGFCCSARCPRAWRVGSLSSSKGQNNLSLMLKRGIGAFPLVLAIIRATRRKSRYRLVYGGRAYATPFAAFGNLHAEGDPQEATRSAPSEEHKPRADSGKSRNGSDSLDDASRHATVAPIARSRHRRLLRTRNRGAGRPPRDPTVSGARQSQVREGASIER